MNVISKATTTSRTRLLEQKVLRKLRAENALLKKENELQRRVSKLSEQKLSTAFRHTADMIGITRMSDGTFLDVNDAFTKFTGYTREEAIGKTVKELRLWVNPAARVDFINILKTNREIYCYEALARIKSGELRMESLSAEVISIDGEECIVTVWRDITEQKKTEAKLRLQNAYLSSLHETTLALINRLDITELLEIIVQKACALAKTANAYISLLNPATGLPEITIGSGIYETQVGRTFQPNEGISGTVWYSGHPLLVTNYQEWPNRSNSFIADRITSALGIPLLSSSGVVGVIGMTTIDEDKHLGIVEKELLSRFAELASIALDNAKLYTASQKEIAERIRIEDELRFISTHDYVTGLYNRAKFEEELKLWETAGAAYCLLVCDVDGLKLINDSLGHHVGDAVLLAAAQVLKAASPEGSLVARVGGDEFAIAARRTGANCAEDICLKIQAAVATFNQANPQHLLSISTGYAIKQSPTDTIASLLKSADDAMYREKLHHGYSVRSSIVQGLLKALEARDYITEGHADRMQDIASELGTAIGMTDREVAQLRLIAQFHDIGKVGIPDRILFKKGRLTPQEFTDMKRHCEIGHRIALSVPELSHIAEYILSHHEWWDGNGYPRGLKGTEIPLECRIIAIADSYDAMTNNRPYRKALTYEEAKAEIKNFSGKQFDPHLVEVFIKSISNCSG
ncbi:HD domain-containing phosphohydrolase [Sporomusa malonica]|uniref:PAS domain S-box-containing protein/diguanylate cyclase (GGDEF) domain-containing protein n=1 Tax=Sporomusa malonica TaxID=112901 RepID=A0A1W1ZQN3_9FIRM|nr:HD domain-containing phosphohydrolase [Sporomusa malonica]SMC50381.1 PAS domain S-box-containing protein/diguanylate cyclase (GGDEF) domain-containing protein [Sporomusa malonica]